MTKGVGVPGMTVDRSSFATRSAPHQAATVIKNMNRASCSAKKAATRRANTGSLAPQFINGTVRSVASRSRRDRSVLVGHDARYGAAAGNAAGEDKRHDRAAVKTEHPKDTIQHEGHSGQIARILQNRDAEEHEHDQGNKPENPADTIDNARDDQ